MQVKFTHSRHWTWEISPSSEVRPGEPVVLISPHVPTVVKVRRLHEEPNETIVEIPDDELRNSVAQYAAGQGAEKPLRKHLYRFLEIHLHDIVHKHHSPQDHWTDIEVSPHDSKLEAYLKDRLLPTVDDGDQDQ